MRFLNLLNRLHRLIAVGMSYLSSLFLIIIMIFIVLDVLARLLLSSPLAGVPEIVKFSIVLFLWLQITYLIHSGGLIRATLITDLGGPRLRWTVDLVSNLLGLAFFGLVLYFFYPELGKAFTRNSFEGEWPVRIPLWPIWGIINFGALMSSIEFLRRTIVTLLAWRCSDVRA
jgi:TRAP-type C4-dicarboxylate transport system permease small subunit